MDLQPTRHLPRKVIEVLLWAPCHLIVLPAGLRRVSMELADASNVSTETPPWHWADMRPHPWDRKKPWEATGLKKRVSPDGIWVPYAPRSPRRDGKPQANIFNRASGVNGKASPYRELGTLRGDGSPRRRCNRGPGRFFGGKRNPSCRCRFLTASRSYCTVSSPGTAPGRSLAPHRRGAMRRRG